MAIRFDTDAIRAAKQQLDIKLPVLTTITTVMSDHRRGNHIFVDAKHYIRIAQARYEEMNHTFWHELAHCMQTERYLDEEGISTFDSVYEKESAGILATRFSAYYMNTYEVEARAIADENSHKMLFLIGD